MGIYSEGTLNQQAQSSRNLEWRKVVWEIKEELVGEDVPLVYDREFSAQQWLETMNEAGLHYVVRLNTASRVKIKDEGGREIPLWWWAKGRPPTSEKPTIVERRSR